MVKIAKSFHDEGTRQIYLDACSRFRFPYWDPCLPRQLIDDLSGVPADSARFHHEFGIPKIVSTRRVYLRKPENPEILVEEDNPLYQYRFPTDFQAPNNPQSFWNHKLGNVRSSSSHLRGDNFLNQL
jgi:hypothetical protein